MAVRFLVVDGNPREARERHQRTSGQTNGESYVKLLSTIEPEADCAIICPADADAGLPDGGLSAFDAVVIGGSQLHMEAMSPEVTRQLDLMRAVFRAQVPAFGSCWGVQVAGMVAGGEARRNPNGPEYGFARRLARTEAGRGHPLLEERPDAYDAPAIHLDAVVTPPPDCTVLASNRVLPLQAVEIRHEGGVFWGTQYHPELDLSELATLLEQFEQELVEEKLARTGEEVRAYAADLRALHADPKGRTDLAWRHGLDAQVLDPVRRTCELRNFIGHLVKPTKSARGRA